MIIPLLSVQNIPCEIYRYHTHCCPCRFRSVSSRNHDMVMEVINHMLPVNEFRCLLCTHGRQVKRTDRHRDRQTDALKNRHRERQNGDEKLRKEGFYCSQANSLMLVVHFTLMLSLSSTYILVAIHVGCSLPLPRLVVSPCTVIFHHPDHVTHRGN